LLAEWLKQKECLPSKPEALSSKTIATKKDKNHGHIENLTFEGDGPSWKLITALRFTEKL
jgi:hypothetical protein